MATVRAKFRVESVTFHREGHTSIKLFPVPYISGSGSDPEDKRFIDASAFVAGAECYVDFTPCQDEEK